MQPCECFDNNRLNETIEQNMQSLNKQNVNNVQYKISRDYPKTEAQRELKGKTAEKLRGGHQAQVNSNQMVLVMARQGGWTA
jgi:hypothetical protein